MQRISKYTNGDFLNVLFKSWIAKKPLRICAGLKLQDSLANAEKLRARNSQTLGLDIPQTLVLSLTNSCNLNCSFCFEISHTRNNENFLSKDTVASMLKECTELGIGRVALVGGEPLLSPFFDSLPGEYASFLFEVFTNGRLLTKERIRHLASFSNLVLALNISESVSRDGCLDDEMKQIFSSLSREGLFFGFTSAVHSQNVDCFENDRLLRDLNSASFGIIFDYTAHFGCGDDTLILSPGRRNHLISRMKKNGEDQNLLLLFLPEDEHIMGGCSASGRLSMHVTSNGMITPCPFVPYSKHKYGEYSLLDALESEYFKALRSKTPCWEKLDGSCAFRAAEKEFLEISESHGAIKVSSSSMS